MQNKISSPTSFAKGNPVGRRIDYIFAKSQAINTIQEFSLDLTISIPTHRPLCITIQIQLFSFSITRLALPLTCHRFPKPTQHFLDIFSSLFQWDIIIFDGDVEHAYACWNQWTQQYLTILNNVDFHSRGDTPCLKTGSLALPTSRQLPTTHHPYIARDNRTISAISELYHTPSCLNTVRFRSFFSDLVIAPQSLLPSFHAQGPPLTWLPLLGEFLINYRI